jgi:hypothetical protein
VPSTKKKTLEFTFTEKNGDRPLEEWLIPGLKEFAKQKYGLNLNVWIKEGGLKHGKHSETR